MFVQTITTAETREVLEAQAELQTASAELSSMERAFRPAAEKAEAVARKNRANVAFFHARRAFVRATGRAF